MEDKVSLERYSEMLILQEKINKELQGLFEDNKHKGREYLSSLLVNSVDAIVKRINSEGGSFGPCSYGGDIDFENSEQSWSDGKTQGEGVILDFVGFSCQVTWKGSDKYPKC